jgi:hypothetical protein
MVSEVLVPALAPDPEGHPSLPNHPTQSATTIHAWSAAFFGIPFLVAGLAIGLAALDRLPEHPHASDWLLGLVAGVFFFGGTFFTVHGIRGVMHKAADRCEAAECRSEPWLYDFPWRRDGIASSSFDDMLSRLLAAMVWTTFLVPFAWVGMNLRGAWPFLAASGIFGVLGLIFWLRWAQGLLDVLRYGNSFLTYESFPFALGGTLRARLRSPRNVSAIHQLTLRCVRERYVTTGSGQDRLTRVVCYEIYKDVTTCEGDRLAGNDVPMEFHLPTDQPATHLAAAPPTYWEIEAKGRASSVEYKAVFLIPVYKLPG